MKFIHTADVHLRTSQYGRLDRATDFRNALQEVVNRARINKVDAILDGGDMLDNKQPSPETIQFLIGIDRQLRDACIPYLVVTGNHDMTTPHWIQLIQDAAGSDNLAEGGLHLIDHKTVRLTNKSSGVSACIQGVPFMPREELVKHLKTLAFIDGPEMKGAVRVLLMHTPIQEFAGFPMESAPTLDEIPGEPWDMVLLGDLHEQNYLKRVGGSQVHHQLIGYPGSTESCSIAEDKERTMSLFTLSKGTSDNKVLLQHDLLPTNARPVRSFTVASDDSAQRMFAELAGVAMKHPIVVVRMPFQRADIVAKLNIILDPQKCILRILAGDDPELLLNADGAQGRDAVASFADPQPRLRELAHAAVGSTFDAEDMALVYALLVPGVDVATSVQKYIQKEEAPCA